MDNAPCECVRPITKQDAKQKVRFALEYYRHLKFGYEMFFVRSYKRRPYARRSDYNRSNKLSGA